MPAKLIRRMDGLQPEQHVPLMVPDIGDAERIELVGWNVAAGDAVQVDQELCELVTDKASFPLESPYAGRIVEIRVQRGSLVRVGDVLAILDRSM